jgi:hypothetical protein
MFAHLVETAKIFLINDPAFVKDENAIGILRREGFLLCHQFSATRGRESHGVNTVIDCVLYRDWRTDASTHLLCGHQFPNVAYRPSQLWKAEEIRFRLHNQPLRRWGKAHHPA